MATQKVRCFLLVAIVCVAKCQEVKDNGDGYRCEFATDMCGLTNEDGNWVREQGPTPTPNTGPPHDHSNDGYYVFMNAALVGYEGAATMVTPTFSSTTNSCLKFWYYMFGKDCGYLTVSVIGASGSETTVWSRWFDQGNQWLQAQVNLIAKESYQIKFFGYHRISYQSFEGDLAIDDIRIDGGSCEEIGDCDFESGTCSWTNDAANVVDWSRKKAGDVTFHGTPNKDHTMETEDGYLLYLYFDGSEGSGKKSRFISQPFPSTNVNGRCLQFWYYATGSPATLTIYVDYGSMFPGMQNFWKLTLESTNDWNTGFVPVNSEIEHKVIIEVLAGGGTGVVAIDDVSFRIGWCDISPTTAYPPTDPSPPPTAPPHVRTPSDCDFESGLLCSWSQPKDDDFDWTVVQAKTNAGHGPLIDASEGTGDGWYIYVESEGQTAGDKARLVSDDIPASNQSCVTFWYHKYGAHENILSIYAEAKGTVSVNPIWRREGGGADPAWIFGFVAFSSPDDFKLIFEAECGSGSHGDIALDDIKYIAGECPNEEHDGITCDFEDPINRMCSWEQETDEDFDWVVGTGATRIHEDIGPAFDHTTRTENGHFIYIDASEHEEGEVASIISGKHDWKTSSVFKCWQFYYHHWHETGEMTLQKQFEFKGKTYRMFMGGTIRSRGDNWAIGSLTVLELYEHPQGKVQLIIKNSVGPNDKGDMSYDDIRVVDGRCYIKGNEDFEGRGLAAWLNDDANVDKFDWLVATGDNAFGLSGPNVDHTSGTETGKYALFDVSGGSQGDNAILKSSPEMLWTVKALCFGFWYHMSGENIGELRVNLRDTSMDPVKDTLLWSLSGPQTSGDSWKEAIIPLPDYPTLSSEIVFEGIRGEGNQGDIAIDDTAIYLTPCSRVLPPEAEPIKNLKSKGNIGLIVGVAVSVTVVVVIIVAVVVIVLRKHQFKLSALSNVVFRRSGDTAKLEETVSQ